MPTIKRIGILGLGGVGGYFGGYLAKKYFQYPDIEIIFITRSQTEKIIKKSGLTLITPTETNVIYPSMVTSDQNEIGILDLLICTVKSYDLVESLSSLKNCISEETIILPLLNGVDAKETIAVIYPKNEILDGCVYIVSRLIEPGIVKKSGNIQSLYFGSKSAPTEKLKQLEKIFQEANIDAYLSENIEQTIWEKFIFISSLASLTSYLNLSAGQILENELHTNILKVLIKELISVAEALHISLPANIFDKTLQKIKNLPFDATSSMHHDFQKGGKTEYRSLTEYVTLKGVKVSVATPQFDVILADFIAR
ncbi:MAG: 2-dehydropantoate 2-reductase [Bacteroidota bacterium]|nr:2-dehydropantoate 2-reductase [Bacteroidota bacterium]